MTGPYLYLTMAILDSPEDRARVEMFAGEEGMLWDGYDESYKGHVLSFRDDFAGTIRRRLKAAGVRTEVSIAMSFA